MRIACSLLFFLAACSSSPAATDAGPDGSAVDAAPDVEGFDAPALDAPEDVVGAEAAADAPADVPASFDPTQLPNLALWLRSDLGVTASGTAVIAWADQSGNHNDFADDGTSPILQAKAFNGLPAVDA